MRDESFSLSSIVVFPLNPVFFFLFFVFSQKWMPGRVNKTSCFFFSFDILCRCKLYLSFKYFFSLSLDNTISLCVIKCHQWMASSCKYSILICMKSDPDVFFEKHEMSDRVLGQQWFRLFSLSVFFFIVEL